MVKPGPDRTEDAIIKESVLINTYRSSYLTLEKNLVLNHLSTHHTDPDMTLTYDTLLAHMDKHQPNKFIKGRATALIPDIFEAGLRYILVGKDPKAKADGEGEEEDVEEEGMGALRPAMDMDDAMAGTRAPGQAANSTVAAAEAAGDIGRGLGSDEMEQGRPPPGPDDELQPELGDLITELDM